MLDTKENEIFSTIKLKNHDIMNKVYHSMKSKVFGYALLIDLAINGNKRRGCHTSINSYNTTYYYLIWWNENLIIHLYYWGFIFLLHDVVSVYSLGGVTLRHKLDIDYTRVTSYHINTK